MRIPLLNLNITRGNSRPTDDAQLIGLLQRLKANQDKRLKLTMAELKNKVAPPETNATFDEMLQTVGAGVWIYSAVMAIGEDSASLEWAVFNQDGEEVDSSLPKRPNEMMTWTFMRHLTQNYLDLTGNAYWYRNPETDEFFPLRPSRVQVVPKKGMNAIAGYAYKKDGFITIDSSSNGQNRYFHVRNEKPMECTFERFDENLRAYKNYLESGAVRKAPFKKEEWIPLEADDVFHFKYPHPFNDYYGLSPLSPLLITFLTETYARQWNRLFFENGAIPPIILSFAEGVSEEEFESLRKHYKQEHGGIRNVWQPFVVENNQAKIDIVPINHTDMGFMNLLKMTREDTLAVFKVPPIKVGIYEFSNASGRSAGAEQQREQYWTDTIIPRVLMQQDVINVGYDFGDGNELKYDIFSIPALQPNLLDTARASTLAAKESVLTREEIRRFIWQPLFPELQDIPNDIDALTDGTGKMFAFPKKKDSFSEEIRKALWEDIVKGFEEREDALFDWIVEMFRAQQVRVLNATRREFNKDADDLVNVIPSLRHDEDSEFQEQAEIIFTDLLDDAGNEALQRAGVSISFDVFNPLVVQFISEKAFKFADEVNDTTLERLREQLIEAAQQGESIEEIAKRIRRNVFSDGIRGRKARSKMIARTEATSLSNGGANLAYKQHPDIVQKKEWLSSRDERVRQSHITADGQTVGLDETFTVGGSLMRHPGDPSAPPEETIRCRCAMVAVLTN